MSAVMDSGIADIIIMFISFFLIIVKCVILFVTKCSNISELVTSWTKRIVRNIWHHRLGESSERIAVVDKILLFTANSYDRGIYSFIVTVNTNMIFCTIF
jgi:hypothetical protein